MDIDLEKLRTELKSRVDEVIDSYLSVDNSIVEIPQDKIYMEFNLDGQDYIAFSESSPETEEMDMMFAKVNVIEGIRVLRNIEIEAEYQNVVNEFNRRLELISD